MARQRSNPSRTAGFGRRERKSTCVGVDFGRRRLESGPRRDAPLVWRGLQGEKSAECGHALHLMCSTRGRHCEDFGQSRVSSDDRLGGHGQHAGLGEDEPDSFGWRGTPTWTTRRASARRGDQTGQTAEPRLSGRSRPGRTKGSSAACTARSFGSGSAEQHAASAAR